MRGVKGKGGTNVLSTGGKGSPLSRAIAFFDIAFSTLGVGIVKNSLAIKERREEKGRVKPTKGGREIKKAVTVERD